MTNKQIIGLSVIVFLAFVGYKFISSGIQENKEKAVLQEKNNLLAQAKKPLEACLYEIDYTSIRNTVLENIMNNPVAMQYSIMLEARERCSLEINELKQYNCALNNIFGPEITYEEKQSRFRVMMATFNAQHALEEKAKSECYRRYK